MGAQEASSTHSPEVGLFRQILIWPLLLRPHLGLSTGSQVLEECSRRLETSTWKEFKVVDERRSGEIRFEEIVYFHPFVRDFLYGNARDQLEAMRVFRRDDIKAVRFELDPGHRRTYESEVKRIDLYVFDTTIALFVIELDHSIAFQGDPPLTRPLSLGEVETILDELRRAYPPYWDVGDDGKSRPGRFPLKVTWVTSEGDKSFEPSEDVFRRFTTIGAEPPIAEHWAFLLHPLVPYEGGSPRDQDRGRLPVQQIEDERIPSMCFLAFDNPRALTEGDMARLALLDAAGSSATLPYSRSFLEDFAKTYCLDIFWGPRTPRPSTDRDDPAAECPWWSTRYMCCGYGFTVVGEDDRGSSRPFVTNEENGLLFHFTHHYLKIGLIAHFHRASLLMFSERLSEVVKAWVGHRTDLKRYAEFRESLQNILDEFLRFRSRYWFLEVSNQIQAQSLFDLWSRHLNTRNLFEQVLGEARTITEVLDTREQIRQADAATRLNVVVAFGMVASLTLALLSTPFLAAQFTAGSIPVGWILGSLALFLVLLGILIFFSAGLARWVDSLADESKLWRKTLSAKMEEINRDSVLAISDLREPRL